MTVMLGAYRVATSALEPLVPRLLQMRVRQGKEDPVRWREKLGETTTQRPAGPLVWLHGVSVGEALSLLPLIDRLRAERPDLSVLVTTGTRTAAEMMARRLPEGVVHQFAPVDTPEAVDAFLDHWSPSLAVFVESELWPNQLFHAKQRGVKLALVSARVTEKTVKGWSRFREAAARLLGLFDLVMPQDAVSAERLGGLGARIDGLINLKLAGNPLPHDAKAFRRLSAAVGDRPVILAASTHEGEEAALARWLKDLPALLIVAPRHPERSAEIVSALRAGGHAVAVRSAGAEPGDGVYLADTLGEMGLFLRLADVVVMGGSFAPLLSRPVVGGHNPLEPARLARAMIAGPDDSNWQAVTAALVEAGGLVQVSSSDELRAAVYRLLVEPAVAKSMGLSAQRLARDAGAQVDRLMEALTPLLPERAA